MSAVTEVRSASFGLVLHAQHILQISFVCWYGAPLVSVITTLYYVAILVNVKCGIARFLCAMCVFVPNLVSAAASIAELAHGEKSRSLLIHSITQLSQFDAPGPKLAFRNK